jgi:hypothetical protein
LMFTHQPMLTLGHPSGIKVKAELGVKSNDVI